MGLFGYGKGDYEKNTTAFKNRVNGLLMDLSRFGEQEFGISGVLFGIMNNLDKITYPKGKGKEQEAVDARISKLIDSMQQDLQKKNAASFSEHARMLADAIDNSRRYGKEADTPEQIQAQEGMANCKGQIGDAINEKAIIERKKEELLKRAKKLLSEGKQAEAQKLNIEYNACVQNEKIADKKITAFSAQYNAFLKIASARANGILADQLDANKLINGSLADFDKELRTANMKLEKALGNIKEVGNIVDNYETDAMDSMQGLDMGANLMDLAENSIANDMKNSVSDANVDVSATDEADDFMKMLNNMK